MGLGASSASAPPPADGLRPELAAFSGRWAGRWSGILESVLIVEQIDAKQATIILAWGDAPRWKIEKGFMRQAATVVDGPDAEIRFVAGSTFTVRMKSDFSQITVKRLASSGRVDTGTLNKMPP